MIMFFFCCSLSEIADAAMQPAPNHISLEGVFTTDLGVVGNSASALDGVAMITNGNANQVGAVWSTSQNLLDFTKDFNAVAYVNQGDSGASSGDGMVFVLQGVSNQLKWFTYSGASMGALGENKYNGALGIPNSIGVEFDLFGNNTLLDGYFDSGVTSPYNNNHVAVVYPGTKDGYADNWSIINSSRNVIHQNVIKDIDLAYGNWTRFELDWKTNEVDYTKGILTAKVKNAAPIQINPAYLNSQVFQNGTVSTAYWGFTGSTGPNYKAKQQVVFEKVPGLVEAETSLSIASDDGKVIESGSTLPGASLLKVTMNAKWLHGKQNWQNIIANTTLPPSLKLLPHTTKINGVSLPDSVWNANALLTKQGDIPDIGNYSGNEQVEATLTFDVQVVNDSFTNQIVTNRFSGRNAIYDLNSFQFNVEKQLPKAAITAPETGTVFLAGEQEQLNIDFFWMNPEKTTVSQTAAYIQEDKFDMFHYSEPEDASAGEGTWSYDFTDTFNSLDYGSFDIFYNIQIENGEQVNVQSTFYKQFRPKVKIKEKETKPSYHVGDPIPIEVNLEDKDSTTASLYVQIDEGAFEKVKDITNDIETTTIVDYTVSTEALTPGYHKLNAYVIDSEGNQSATVSLESIAIEGELKITSFPESFSKNDVKIGGPEAKIVDLGKIAVIDQRLLSRGWSLSAQLVEGRFTAAIDQGRSSVSAHEDFFFYRDGSKDLPIAEAPASIMKATDELNLDEVVLDQEGEKGFYFKPSNDMASGSYTATVNWILSSAPE